MKYLIVAGLYARFYEDEKLYKKTEERTFTCLYFLDVDFVAAFKQLHISKIQPLTTIIAAMNLRMTLKAIARFKVSYAIARAECIILTRARKQKYYPFSHSCS